MSDRVLIVGADAAGLKTAARLRRLQPDAPITVLDRGRTISYAACGFPYFLSGDIDEFAELTRTAWGQDKDPAYFSASKGIEVLTGREAIAIDRDARRVTVRDVESGETVELDYATLVLATGATPSRPAVPGVDRDDVLTFTRPDDVQQLRGALQRNEIGRVAVIGGGYIGLELAEAFSALWGVDVVLAEREEHVMPGNLDPEMADLVEDHLRAEGVDLRLGVNVTRVYDRKGSFVVCLDPQVEEVVDRVIVATGVQPNAVLAEAAGLTLGASGGILVDAHGQTSDPRVFAAGDCAELPDSRGTRLLPLGSIANRMGRAVADRIAGVESPGLPRVWGAGVVKVFDRTAASVGLSATRARALGMKVEEYWGSFPDKAHYYPESHDVKIKLVREAHGPILGLQAVGEGEVVRWVDAMALILELADGDPDALHRFEHAYAPPYATAMDPFHHFAGMIEVGSGWQVSPAVLREGGEPGWVWINLLEPIEQEMATLPHIRGRVENQSLAELRECASDYENQEVVCFCARGPRSYEAARLLRAHGVHARYLAGGIAFLSP